MADTEKIYSGPGIFIWGVDEDGEEETDAVVIDMTQGGITFTTTTTYFEPTLDQTGTAPVDSFITGMTGAVTFETPDTDFEKVAKFNPNVIKVVDATEPTKIKYQVTGLAGKKLPKKRAVIKPLGVDDPDRFIYLESATIKSDLNAQFVLDNNIRLPINVTAHPSLSATPKGLVYTWGDITAAAATTP